jgi:hypothetical protein
MQTSFAAPAVNQKAWRDGRAFELVMAQEPIGHRPKGGSRERPNSYAARGYKFLFRSASRRWPRSRTAFADQIAINGPLPAFYFVRIQRGRIADDHDPRNARLGDGVDMMICREGPHVGNSGL